MNFPQGFGRGDWNWKMRSATHDAVGFWDGMPAWLIPLIVFVFVCILVLVLVLKCWVSARGKFVYVDCIVRNRGAIVEPWNEYKREGNSYFSLYACCHGMRWILIAATAASPLLDTFRVQGRTPGWFSLS